ncbi:hypothetical protein ABTNL_45 [Pseudomonas phage vB_PaeP_PPA-ABTNL]|uniref:Uncharacterized protein n=1 Tax=Pseudomonas phage vB_PaeP_PPA-ABTNL TaxID=1527525 RepID=A0A0B4N5C8_9CAUD|nr:hypothetical protein ACQ50_gp45 [Pseudomonas phage vB_PaeP_PPA-ABTNL]AIK67606.1 hypothetical protein ABTNL_45 [Pseudomonas phage vB_PaeP_PPA-ABTNL]
MRGIIAGIVASQIRRPKPVLTTITYPQSSSDRGGMTFHAVAGIIQDTVKFADSKDLGNYEMLVRDATLKSMVHILTEVRDNSIWSMDVLSAAVKSVVQFLTPIQENSTMAMNIIAGEHKQSVIPYSRWSEVGSLTMEITEGKVYVP